jgi:colanic acid/amylovoran biosynthesis protein
VPPADLKAAYGHLDILIGTRMHSVIFALTEGVPSLAIGYLHKTRGLMRMVGLEDCMLDIDNIQMDQMTQVLEKLWSERNAVRARIQGKVPWMVENARQAGELIAADYRSLMGI